MRRRLILVLGAVVLLVATGFVVEIGPRNILGMARYDSRRQGTFAVGDRTPDVDLVTTEGAHVRLLEQITTKPTVLVFGSFT
jgi:hypothetical protein